MGLYSNCLAWLAGSTYARQSDAMLKNDRPSAAIFREIVLATVGAGSL